MNDAVAALRVGGSVYAEKEARALASTFAGRELDDAVARRVAGEPLEHVLGFADFAGVRVVVRSPVFVPRRRAEVLVDVAADLLRDRASDAVVVDVGCGSGAIAAALVARAPGLRCHAVDVDPDAVACARENGGRFGFTVHEGSWLDALPTGLLGAVDVAVGHLPYVPTADLALLPGDYRGAEREIAVDGGSDGLDPLRAVLDQLPRWLTAGGSFVTQVAPAQAGAAAAAARCARLVPQLADDAGGAVLVVHRAIPKNV